MARPNTDQGLRLLVCSRKHDIVNYLFNVFNDVNGDRQEARCHSFKTLMKDRPITLNGNGFELTWAENDEQLKELIESNAAPYYAAILYDAETVEKNGPKIIAGVRRRDFFVPQIIVEPVSSQRMEQATKAGKESINFAYTEDDIKHTYSNIFLRDADVPNLTVVKIGGSAFDFDDQVYDGKNIDTLCNILWKIHQEEKDDKERSLNRMLLTVGAGQIGEKIKNHYKKFGNNPKVSKAFPELMAKALQLNLEQLYAHFGENEASLLSSGAFYFVGDKRTRNKIPLIGMAPHYILARDGIPLQDSDTHTIALAEFYKAKKVVLVKRTDGIYDFDPYLGFALDQETGRCKSTENWIDLQRRNKRLGVVDINDMLNGHISRTGTNFNIGKYDGSSGHLMEDSALDYFRYCQHVEEILVVHIAPEEMYYGHNHERNKFWHVVTGEILELGPGGWEDVLEQRLRAAFKGGAVSKIVKPKDLNTKYAKQP